MRRILAALVLVFSLASLSGPALAAVCSPTPALPDSERRTEYAGIVAQTGPFNVGFQLYGDSTDYGNWVSVWVNGVALTPVTDFTVTSPSGPLANLCRPITDAQVTFTAAQTGTIEIEGSRRPRRTSQFSENAGVTARSLNQVLSDMEAQLRERWDRQSRLVRSPPGETLNVLPPAATRASKFLFFDNTGNTSLASPTPGLGNVVGPSTTIVGDYATWANTSGTLLADGGPARTQLTAGRTYFVNGSTGSDSNSGLTAGAPLLTPQRAFNIVCNTLDLAGNTVLIDLSDNGAYTGSYPSAIPCMYVGYSGSNGQATVVVRGAAARSATCVNYPTLPGITAVDVNLPWTFKNLQINGQSEADAGSWLAFDGICSGPATGPQFVAVNAGSKIEFINNPYTINGAATGGHIQASFGAGILYQATVGTVTITGTPAMGGQFASASYGGTILCQDITFTGAVAASTKHYIVDNASNIQCGKTGISPDPNLVLPGDTAGTGFGAVNQFLVSNGPGINPAFIDLTNYLSATAPLSKSGSPVVNFSCPSCLSVASTGHGDSIYTILSTDRYVYTTAALTAPRIWTLPAANSVAAGTTITVQDATAGVTSTNTLSVARAGADTIDGGASSIVISSAGGGSSFTSDGVSNWGNRLDAVSQGGTGRNTLTNHGVLVGAAAAPITQLAVGANGSLLLGSTGADPAFAAMSQDATITNAGVITVTGVNGVNLNTAWSTYTPSVNCGTGSITTSSATGRQKTLGKTVFWEATVTVTTNGTCASNLQVGLPTNAASFGYSGIGVDTSISGKAVSCNISAGSGVCVMRFYDGTYPAVNGTVISISGLYEIP